MRLLRVDYRCAIFALLVLSTTTIATPTAFEARNIHAEVQQLRAQVRVPMLDAPPNVASFYVTLANALIKPAYLRNEFHDAATIFRDQVRCMFEPVDDLKTTNRSHLPNCLEQRRLSAY